MEMKQYQQDYNSTPGPTTVQTLIISEKKRHSEVLEPGHVTLDMTRVHSNRDILLLFSHFRVVSHKQGKDLCVLCWSSTKWTQYSWSYTRQSPRLTL